MEKDHKLHRVTSIAEQNPNTTLFRARLSVFEPDGNGDIVHRFTAPLDARFKTADEAESYAMQWAIEWIDQKTANRR
jgi:hypothetical protein